MIHETIDLWRDGEYNGADKNFRPTLDTYVLKDGGKKGAVLIFPGGGYVMTSWREAEPIAAWVNAAGYHAFVLNYSVAPNKHPQPLLDAAKAIRVIREHAETWRVDADKIAVCGFSAGGHLAASLGVHYDAPYLQTEEGADAEKNRPNALILCYPVITSGDRAHRGSFDNLLGKDASEEMLHYMSLEKQVKPNTPPAFLWATFNDGAVPVESSLTFAAALRENGVPFELHIFPDGVHGLSLCNQQTWDGNDALVNPQVSVWTDLCKTWLKATL
ncbi:MAG: alpha/beta hydrolase [Clostridiales bacterium]|jgi:acetyl esterase/lipase|nr:alpha/beta hydrolase [Clostridiales bacterium]